MSPLSLAPPTAAARTRYLSIAACIVLVIALAITGFRFYSNVTGDWTHFDDAYMFIRYADNLIAGNGYSWNGEERTYGCTSITYTLFIALVKLIIGGSLSSTAILLCSTLLWGGLALGLIYLTLRRAGGLSWQVAAFVVSYIMVEPLFSYHMLSSGMDTMLSVFSLSALLFVLTAPDKAVTRRRAALLALLAYLAFLTRPENGIYAVMLPGLFFMHKGERPGTFISFYASLFVLLALDTGAKYLYFGDPLPLSFYAKSAGFYQGYAGGYKWMHLKYLKYIFFFYGAPLLLLLLYIDRKRLKTAAVFLLPFAVTAGYLATVVQVMGGSARFYVPSVPVLVCGAFIALCGMRFAKPKTPNIMLALAGVAAYAMLFFYSGVQVEHQKAMAMEQLRLHREGVAKSGYACKEVSEYGSIEIFNLLLKDLPDNVIVSASEYGLVAAENPGKIIVDLIGLHNRLMHSPGGIEATLRQTRPDFIWMPHEDYIRLREEIIGTPYFRDNYEFIPEALHHGIAFKKEGTTLTAAYRAGILQALGCTRSPAAPRTY